MLFLSMRGGILSCREMLLFVGKIPLLFSKMELSENLVNTNFRLIHKWAYQTDLHKEFQNYLLHF